MTTIKTTINVCDADGEPCGSCLSCRLHAQLHAGQEENQHLAALVEQGRQRGALIEVEVKELRDEVQDLRKENAQFRRSK